MTVGENIKRLRKEKGLTQKQLSELSGINEAQIRRYELGGKNANPKIETIEKIAKALDAGLYEILESIYISDYEKTEEYKKHAQRHNSLIGIISILNELYGDIQFCEHLEDAEDGFSVSVSYYIVGTDENKFVLQEGDIDTLLNYVKSSLPFIVDTLKDERTEKEITKEIFKKNLEILKKLSNGEIKSTRLMTIIDE